MITGNRAAADIPQTPSNQAFKLFIAYGVPWLESARRA